MEKLKLNDSGFESEKYRSFLVTDDDNLTLRAQVYGNTLEESKANAERLVKCWNMHDDLVRATKLLLGALMLLTDNGDDLTAEGLINVEEIKKILKQDNE